MVINMGYYDNVLEHSSGPWKKHKYIQKIGEGASAKYKYAKDKVEDAAYNAIWTAEDAANNVGKKLSDVSGYTQRQKMLEAQRLHRNADSVGKDIKAAGKKYNDTSEGQKNFERIADESTRWRRDTARGAEQVYSKTPLGKIESSVKRGQKIIDNLFGKKKLT